MTRSIQTLLLFVALTGQATAFEFNGGRWAGGEMVLYAQLPGSSPNGIPWSVAVNGAIDDWNSQVPFRFIVRNEQRNPCGPGLFNSIGFSTTVCGSSFGASTLAVTLYSFQESELGPAEFSETDIIINSNRSFEVFDGPLGGFPLGSPSSPFDLRRVMLHELGHALGLSHENGTAAIMNSAVGNVDRLRQDDIDGAVALYDGIANCQVRPLFFGSVNESLQPGDCTVDELFGGGSDESPIDVWRLELTGTTDLVLETSGVSLDTVVFIADEQLRIFGVDDNGGSGCNARLSRTVQAGTYLVMANTYHGSSSCGTVTGDYRLDVTYTSSAPIDVIGGNSLQGGFAKIQVFAGITADDGVTYGNRFASTQSLDLLGRILVDPAHQGQPGFLVMAALIEGSILIRNLQGQWIALQPGQGLVRAEEKILEAEESFTVFEDLVPQDIGVTEIVADFFIGYGLVSDPDEVYFHFHPIDLIVTP